MDNDTINNSQVISDNKSNETSTVKSIIEILQEPRWIVMVYFALLACGGVINLVHTLALIRSRRNGVLSLILQICLVDLCALYVAISEILTLYKQSWYLASDYCPLFKGTEVLANSLTIYLLVCYNFHIISIWNLHELQIKKNNKNPLTSCSNNSDDSNECLVTKQENRLVTIDYRKRKDDISVIFPTIFVWTVSLSLSVPNFTLSSTLKLKENFSLCAVIDVYYSQVLQYSLLIFKIILPIVLLFLSLIILIIKLNQNSKSDIDNIVTKRKKEIKRLLIFGIVLSVVYFITSFQRHFLHFIHIISYSFNKNSINNFKMPPLYNNYSNSTNIMHLAMLHYSGSIVRAFLYLTILPKFTYLVRSKVFCCCTIKK